MSLQKFRPFTNKISVSVQKLLPAELAPNSGLLNCLQAKLALSDIWRNMAYMLGLRASLVEFHFLIL